MDLIFGGKIWDVGRGMWDMGCGTLGVRHEQLVVRGSHDHLGIPLVADGSRLLI